LAVWSLLPTGLSPLHEAILNESFEEVRTKVLRYPLNDRQNLLKLSPLHLAISDPQRVALLLEAGADPNVRDWNGRTPLMYSAVIGSSGVAISLLDNGADPWLTDILYAHEDFIRYALGKPDWSFVMDVLHFIWKSPRFPSEEVSSLMDEVIALWADEYYDVRDSENFRQLLVWGANPNVLFEAYWRNRRETSNTLLHWIDKCEDLDVLVNYGFTEFNHPDGSGARPLHKIIKHKNPKLLKYALDVGCLPALRDASGNTALHVAVTVMSKVWFHLESVREISDASQCVELLLREGSDPLLGDGCQCACSRAGCTPAHLLMKCRFQYLHRKSESPDYCAIGQWIWSIEWLHMLQLIKGREFARNCLLDLMRLAKFEELELTHTCCRQHWYEPDFDDDEIHEILDEEKETAEDLEQQMEEIGKFVCPEPDDRWITELSKLVKRRSKILFDRSKATNLHLLVRTLFWHYKSHKKCSLILQKYSAECKINYSKSTQVT